ncbi:MAG: glycosyltransferase family 2 protein [Chloroflexales bacterium]|nr:glycosyltransferase family 2 protein [Chloroflexales bacterium]
MMPTLAIIIVSWNIRDLLQRCLRATEASLADSGIAHAIIVVDNASSDGTPDMLRAEFPRVKLLEPGHNLGFAGGNNLALRTLGFGAQQHACASSTNGLPQFVLLLNPDTEPAGAALPRLLDYLTAHPKLVAVGPQLRYPDGSIQSSRRRFPARLTFFWESTPLERFWPANPWARRYHCADQSDTQTQAVDWLVGAAILVRGAAIAQAGLLDEQFFMYSEELEWQYRLQQPEKGSRCNEPSAIVYLPDAVIIHHEGKSSEQVLANRHLNFQRSKLRLAYLWYGPFFALALRLFVLLCYIWELGSEGAKLLLGHRRSLRRRRIGVYAAVLRSGLKD